MLAPHEECLVLATDPADLYVLDINFEKHWSISQQ